MKVVITGSTSIPREILTRRCTDAGLDVMNTVSGRTHLLVCNRADEQTGKAARARQHGTPVITEPELVGLLTAVAPGQPKAAAETVTVGGAAVPAPRTPVPSGPLSGRRVLVLGGAHDAASAIRGRVLEAGGSVAVNLTGSVTDVVLVPAPEPDTRIGRAKALGIRPLDADTLSPCSWPDSPAGIDSAPSVSAPLVTSPAQATPATPRILVRGEVMDLPARAEWLAEVRWAIPGRHAADRYEIDVVAFVVDADEQVTVDEDFVFYNASEHSTGAVAVTTGIAGESMCTLRPDRLPPTQRRVLLAAAIDGTAAFGDVGPIELILRDENGAPLARATLDAATDERSLILGTLYQRNGAWRWRAVGQGYPDDLATLAIRHGVDIEEQD
jgi:DNA polymerase III subunit epsilon